MHFRVGISKLTNAGFGDFRIFVSRFTEIPAPALCVGSQKAGEPWVLCLQYVGVPVLNEPQLRSDGVRKICHAQVLWIGYGSVE